MALLNFSLDSNVAEIEVLALPVDPSTLPLNSLLTYTDPSACNNADGSIIGLNPIYDTYFNYELYKNGVLFASSTGSLSFTGLTVGLYYVRYVSTSIYFTTFNTSNILLTAPLAGYTVDIDITNNKINYANANGKAVINVTPKTGVTYNLYSSGFDFLMSGSTFPIVLQGLCATEFILELTTSFCSAYYPIVIRNVGIFNVAGIRRVLYKTNQNKFEYNYHSTLNYITDITLSGTSVNNWNEVNSFSTDGSNLSQTLVLNSSSQQYEQTLTLEFNNHEYYNDVWSEFIKPSNNFFDFLIQDNNGNWWCLGEVNKTILTSATIGKSSEENTLKIVFNSVQRKQMKQVDPDYINSLSTIYNFTVGCSGFYNTGFKSIFIAEYDGTKFPLEIVNNQYIVKTFSGITLTEYKFEESTLSMLMELVKDENGQYFNTTVQGLVGHIGDNDLYSDNYDEETDIEFLLRKKLYILLKDNNDRYWFFGKNGGMKVTEFEKVTGSETNQYSFNFIGRENSWISFDQVYVPPTTTTTTTTTSTSTTTTTTTSTTTTSTTTTTTSAPFVASGGTILTFGSYRLHVFNSSGTFTVHSGSKNVDYLIVGGGGAGAYARNGGGGAGGLLHSFTGSPYSVSTGSYSITVGAGGTGALASGGNGGNSVAFGYTAVGGGGGRADNTDGSGGSGGGNSWGNLATSVAGTAGQGKSGGTGFGSGSVDRQGGGGGGAGAAGGNASSNQGGAGGAGLDMSSYVGTSVGASGWFAGGGGGGSQSGTGGAGGQGGGAAGTATGTGLSGTANTGGGGGSTKNATGTVNGGNGGSGIVIIRYIP